MDLEDETVSCCSWLCPSFGSSRELGANEPLLRARVARENSAGELQRLQSLAQDGDGNDINFFLASTEIHESESKGNGLKKKRKGGNLKFSDIYELSEEIGKGSTATVFRCVKRQGKENNRISKSFSVKIINKKKVAAMYNDIYQQLKREVDILDNLRHPHIIRLYGMFESEKVLHMVTEYASGGELFDYLVSRPNGLLSEAQASQLIRQVVSAVAYMHSNKVIHRDIKLENILLAEKPGKDIKLKIIDFGLAKTMAPNEKAKTFFGTVGYLAPEMTKRRYSFGVDVWAVGVLTYVLLCGVFPFDDDARKNRSSQYKLKFPPWAKNISSSAKDLLYTLLQVKPSARATATEATQHPWVKGETASPKLLLSSPKQLRLVGSSSNLRIQGIDKSGILPDSLVISGNSSMNAYSVSPLSLADDLQTDSKSTKTSFDSVN
mmetsp:Transcript_2237/g.2532  ORF Transcript_2237/g.2532 Transcript_2237/m.2532 type:complete len:436 (-) Transcript_2237:661-1968(-)